MRHRHDAALATARELLDATVCECGHVDADHVTVRPAPCHVCSCPQHRPVAFTVTRDREANDGDR